LEDDVLAVQGRAEDLICCSADLVIANIQYDVLKPLINSSHFRRKKWFVLSGLLRSQAKDVAYQLSQYPFKILNKWGREGIWHTFLGEIIV
jgi:ribosomal protein L11 methyltransferase